MVAENRIKRKISLSVYISMITFTALVFILGIILGNYIANKEFKDVELNQQQLILQLNSFDLKAQIIAGSDICTSSLENFLKERADLGANLEAIESRIGKDKPEIRMQKEIYEMIELKTAAMLNDYNLKCSKSNMIIYFFYTNKEKDPLGNIAASEDQGYILNQFVRNNEDKVHVFSFDINLRNSAIDALVSVYKIEKVPVLIINGKPYDYRTLDELESML
jgi:hypothetical protein